MARSRSFRIARISMLILTRTTGTMMAMIRNTNPYAPRPRSAFIFHLHPGDFLSLVYSREEHF